MIALPMPLSEEPYRYFVLNKLYNMVSQFVSSHRVRLLCHLNFDFPEGTHAIGRLDKDSEGQLLMTTNRRITRLLFQIRVPHFRKYLIQVRGVVDEAVVQQLRTGVSISVAEETSHVTKPCEVELVEEPAGLFSNGKELHERVPRSWLTISLTEGKYHQVRKMVQAVAVHLSPGEPTRLKESLVKQKLLMDWTTSKPNLKKPANRGLRR
jgi:23S rRNA pseudouridine2457 synthase